MVGLLVGGRMSISGASLFISVLAVVALQSFSHEQLPKVLRSEFLHILAVIVNLPCWGCTPHNKWVVRRKGSIRRGLRGNINNLLHECHLNIIVR